MSLTTIVAKHALRQGDIGAAVLPLQMALAEAGYRIGQDGNFGPRTDMVVRQFQTQHGLLSDGIVGLQTAAKLDLPPDTLVKTAAPLVHSSGSPHDDTASLVAFYGKPWEESALLTHVSCPWALYYEGKSWPHPIPIHVKVAPALTQALDVIWTAAGGNGSPILAHVKNYSGSYNYRPVRGSSRLSCHSFGAAIDFDADKLPLGKGVKPTEMPEIVVTAFKDAGFFWGGDFIGRKDPQHFQYAHE